MDKKLHHIQDIDRMLDDEIIEAIEKFKKAPTPANLELYTMLMKADHYTDKWLEEYEEEEGHDDRRSMSHAGPQR